MNTLEEIERVIEQLPPEDFSKLSAWMAQRPRRFDQEQPLRPAPAFRDHSAFLNSYAPEDEGLYDDVARR